MLVISRDELARNLMAYGEQAASERVAGMSQDEFKRVAEIGFRHALTGMMLMKAGCLAAIEVLEGAPRDLKRKRRVWAEAEEAQKDDDPQLAEWMARYGPYLGGTHVKTQDVANQLGALLGPLLREFKYIKSKRQFSRTFGAGESFLRLEFSHGRIHLRFGALIHQVEQIRTEIFGNSSAFYTIGKYSSNMGPDSWHWPYPVYPSWIIPRSEGIERTSREVADVVNDVVLPYLTTHEDPAAIRATLLHTPGRSDDFRSSQTIFSIDRLLGRRDWLDDDYRLLQEQRLAEAARRQRAALEQASNPSAMFFPAPPGVRRDILKEDYEQAVAGWDG
jgi:hypothetical protein